jgi:hypothetical protein
MIADPDYMDFGMKIPGFWKPLTGFPRCHLRAFRLMRVQPRRRKGA